LTDTSGSQITFLSATADGLQVAAIRVAAQTDVYVAELASNGTLRAEPKRFTLDGRNEKPTAWTADSRYVLFGSDRNGTWDIFRQALGSDAAEPLAVGPEFQNLPELGPDGASVIFVSRASQQSDRTRPIRVASPGAVPQEIARCE
jgi:Tol biopolymer transport system component